MNLKILYAIALTFLPITELRIGLPVAISYAIEENIPIFLVFCLIVLLNIILIFFVFWFLDNLHFVFLKFKFYRKSFEIFLKRFQKKVDKFEKRHETLGFVALTLFVAVPLPGTGAWTGCLLAWLLGLDKKKSIFSIAVGVLIAGILILLGSLGFIKLFS
ncbi:MAG: small multi-drug export protein [Nanoarchaeota archaeon]|nr:small multi-drug export protein [Nanoarchaeota archaeon]